MQNLQYSQMITNIFLFGQFYNEIQPLFYE